MAKYNQLLRIEEELGDADIEVGTHSLAPSADGSRRYSEHMASVTRPHQDRGDDRSFLFDAGAGARARRRRDGCSPAEPLARQPRRPCSARRPGPQVEEEIGRPIALIADLQGPKFRVGSLSEPLELRTGDDVTVVVGDNGVRNGELPIAPAAIGESAREEWLVNDGLIRLRIDEVEAERAKCGIVVGGLVTSNKGVVPGVPIPIPGAHPQGSWRSGSSVTSWRSRSCGPRPMSAISRRCSSRRRRRHT